MLELRQIVLGAKALAITCRERLYMEVLFLVLVIIILCIARRSASAFAHEISA